MKRWRALALTTTGLLAAGTALVWALNVRDEAPLPRPDATRPTDASTDPATIARGGYLAQAGNCLACHTVRGGAEYAGGRGIDTPFGTVYSSNLTPDAATGIGRWSSAEFWRALHNGRSRDGRFLYPAFPYTHFTLIGRDDSDALFAYLHSRPAVAQPNRDHALRFPYNTQAALAVWRALYFKPGGFTPDPTQSVDWNRGAYLTRGLAHCSACHSPRDRWGGVSASHEFTGGLMPVQNWYAPSLLDPREAGVAHWPPQHIVQLLQTGRAPGATVAGPMADVVQHSTQHLSDADLQAMATYLKALPPATAPAKAPPPVEAAVAGRGAKLYEQQCMQCHGERGEGVAGAYPALAGNRAVTMNSTANLVQIVLNGGFAPATAGNPRPFGMPPYVLVFSDADTAAVLSHIRNAWGNRAAPVSELDVSRQRNLR